MGDMDLEVLSLLNRVKVVQKELFGSEVRDLEGGGGGKVDKFLDTYDTINNKIDLLHELGAQLQLTNKPGLGATTNFVDPKERIEAQSKFRTTLNEVQEDFNTMETLHRMEKRKKRSRISDEEIQQRENMLLHIERNLQMFKDSQKMNFLNKVAGANPELAKYMQGRRLVNMEDSELFKAPESQQMVDENGEPIQPTGAKYSSTGVMLPTRGPDMTDQHRQQLLLIREKDAKIDMEIGLIGEGVDRLGVLARAARDELQLQSVTIDRLEEKVDVVHDKVLGLNEKMKVTLEQARKSDKIMMDICCILILAGMIIIFYKLST